MPGRNLLVMAEINGLAVRRLLFFRKATSCFLRGSDRRISVQSQGVSPSVPFYRKPWRVFVAVLLERKPVISKDMSEIEQRFAAYQNALEFEQSALSDYEMKKVKLTRGSKPTKKKFTEAEEQKRLECEQELRKIEDEEEEIAEELKNLQVGHRRTSNAESKPQNDLLSHLDQSLHLVIKSSDKWLLPETEISKEENLRQAAERLINSQSDCNVSAIILSNAPAGVYTEEIESGKREESDVQGKKVFYYKAILQSTKNQYPEFDKTSRWLTIKEMQESLPKEHFKQIIKFST